MRVMLRSFSFSCSSNGTATIKNVSAFADDNFRICRNMCLDDLHLFTYRGESLNKRGIYTRRSENRRNSSSTIDSSMLCNSVESMDNCIGVASACFLQTNMMFFIEESSSLSVARSIPSTFRFADEGLESPTSEQQMDWLPQSSIRVPKDEKLCPTDEFGKSECTNMEETMQDDRGKTDFSSDFMYDVESKIKCEGSLIFMNDGEARGKQPGPCLSDNCVDLGVWRRLVSFEIQFGLERLQSLRLGYGSNWNCCTGKPGLNSDKFSKYLVPDINVAKVLDSAKRSLVKLLSLQDDLVSSVDIALNLGLSSTCTATDNSTLHLWDIEFGKCLNKMKVDDYAIVGSHIGNSPGFLLNGIMFRRERASMFLWDPRDFFKPLNFTVGNMSTLHSVQLIDNQICVSDCFDDRLFDLRMLGSSPVEVISPAKPSSSFMKAGSSMPIENSNCLESLFLFSLRDQENEDDNEFYESAEYGVGDSERRSRSCLVEQIAGALRMIGIH